MYRDPNSFLALRTICVYSISFFHSLYFIAARQTLTIHPTYNRQTSMNYYFFSFQTAATGTRHHIQRPVRFPNHRHPNKTLSVRALIYMYMLYTLAPQLYNTHTHPQVRIKSPRAIKNTRGGARSLDGIIYTICVCVTKQLANSALIRSRACAYKQKAHSFAYTIYTHTYVRRTGNHQRRAACTV